MQKQQSLSKGDRVVMHTCMEAEKYNGRVWDVTSDPWQLSNQEVVKLSGFSGGFATQYLQKVNIEGPLPPNEVIPNTSMDITTLVNDAMTNLQQQGTIANIIQKKIESTMNDVFDDVFRSYGDFGKQLKEAVKNTLHIDFDHLDLPSYNVMVHNFIKEKVNELAHVKGIERMNEMLDGMFTDLKPEYKLSELIEEMMESANEDHEKDGESISLHITEPRYGSCRIYFDEDGGVDQYRCKYQLAVKTEGEDKGRIWHVEIEDKVLTNKKLLPIMGGLEQLIFKIYAHGSKLIIDPENIEEDYGYDD